VTVRYIDFSGARPGAQSIKDSGAAGVLRYLSPPASVAPAAQWKVATRPEVSSYLEVGLDVVLNWEWYAGRMLEGAPAGSQDGAWALAAARALGYPKGATVYFSHDTSTRGDDRVAAYLRAASAAMGRYYYADCYSGIGTLAAMFNLGAIRYGWQTLAWSDGNVDRRVHLYQNGKQWYGSQADENVLLKHPLGSWLDVQSTPSQPVPRPAPKPPHRPATKPRTYRVTTRDSDGLIAVCHRLGISDWQQVARINGLHSPYTIHVDDVLRLATSVPASHVPAPVHSAGSYRVKASDSDGLAAAMSRIGVSDWRAVAEINGLHDPYTIHVGDVLRLPGSSRPSRPPVPVHRTYRVQPRDSDGLMAVCRRLGIESKWRTVAQLNGLSKPYVIHAGDVLKLP